MLLANMAVAHKTYKTYPNKALLRRHPPPKSKMMEDLVSFWILIILYTHLILNLVKVEDFIEYSWNHWNF